MRALLAISLISFLPFTAFAALTPGGVERVSDAIKIPDIKVDPSYLAPIDSTKAAGLDVAGATGGLTHPACVAETARRAAMEPPQPPPHGDFPCVVPISNGSGIVDGVCFVNECRGVASTGLNGLMSALGSISSLGSIVGGILARLLQGSPSTPSGGGGDFGSTTANGLSPASGYISAGSSQSPDTSRLLSDSAVVVSRLFSLLNPPLTQTR